MKNCFLWVGLLCIWSFVSAEAPFTKEMGPYRVTYQLVRHFENIFSFRAIVISGRQSVTLATDWRANNEAEAVRQIDRLTGEKDGYLFTPFSCAGGNAWRCEAETVVTNEPRLRVLGAVGRHVDWKKPGESLKDGLFQDGFDGLEINPFTCHAAAPSFTLFLEMKKGRFVVAKESTWRMNETVMNRFRKTYQMAGGKSGSKEEVQSAFLGALALARLCDRTSDWMRVSREGDKIFGRIENEKMSNYVAKTLAKYCPARLPR